MKQPRRHSTTKGFSRAVSLMQTRIRKASEGRGFSQTRLLTHWEEIVGQDTARIATPVNISYSKGGMGATLVILTTGSQAPMLEMQKEQIREKVNACYGYRAIARVKITQTAPVGFADGRVAFTPAPQKTKIIDAAVKESAKSMAAPCQSDALREALETLARNVLSKNKP
ncbi:hypothetical protein SAMN04488515_3261 [Cognatiyoonia koreensis]|uniref:RNA-binding protein n=1 Tax=Cognatiyoonia koreensis TaxID=364200 RepID=A0A1I0RU22_9RHOB|nr:DciA family protein [Cognatiyoonia koreensis]SEW44923.1 hypothetical protein SAMN04488515_3261 [Cognatiyoonia koreensis]